MPENEFDDPTTASLKLQNELLKKRTNDLAIERDSALAELQLIKGSRSWRLTTAFRKANALRRLPPRAAARIIFQHIQSLRDHREHVSTDSVSCVLVTPRHTEKLALAYSGLLHSVGFSNTVTFEMPDHTTCEHLFVFCPNVFPQPKRHYIAVQLEQSTNSRWFTDEYLKKLSDAEAVLDYSRENIRFLNDAAIPLWKLFHVPIGLPASQGQTIPFEEREIDALFYGDMNCPRRKTLIKNLSKDFKIEVQTDLFGEPMWEKIRKSKVVLNLHYYENAILETARLTECMSLGTPVVSETSLDAQSMAEFEPGTFFAFCGDADDIAAKIRLSQDREYWTEKVAGAQKISAAKEAATRTGLYRFLSAKGMIGSVDAEAEVERTFFFRDEKKPRLCLTLAETPEREQFFDQASQSAGFQKFNGMRHDKGWKGCALSFRTMMRIAKKRGVQEILVCEDDVFFPKDYNDRFNVVTEYLKSHKGKWDIFSGFMADISPRAKISHVDVVDGTSFIWLDRFTSTVFNIYSMRTIDALSQWDETIDDPHVNTIDRYMEEDGALRVVLAYPYLVGHAEDLTSTIWGFQNTEYREYLERSSQTLKTLLDDYYAASYST